MSALLFLRVNESLGRKRKDQKRGAKSVDGPEEVRRHRIVYQKMLRQSRRTQILEEKRHVMESLNYMTSWGSDSSDDEDKEDDSRSGYRLLREQLKYQENLPPEQQLSQVNPTYLCELQRLLCLNDEAVTQSVLNLLITMTRTEYGSRVLSTSSSEVVPMALHMMRQRIELDRVLEIISNLFERDSDFARNICTCEFVALISSILNDASSSQQVIMTRILCAICKLGTTHIAILLRCDMMQHLCNMLYFGEGKTQLQVVEMLNEMSIQATDEQVCTIFDAELLDAMKVVMTGDLHTAYRSLHVLKSLFARSNRTGAFTLMRERISENLHEPLDRLFESQNSSVSLLASSLLDQMDPSLF